MSTYKITDSISGKTYRLTGDVAPTQEDLEEMFPSESPVLPSQPAPQEQSLGQKALDVVGGALEVPAAIATGAVAGGLGLLGGIAKTFTSGDVEGKKTREEITNAFTYKPKTVSGKGAMDIIGTALSPLGIPRSLATKMGGEQYGNVAEVAMFGLLPKVPSAVRAVRNLPYKTGELLYTKQLQPTGELSETVAKSRTGFEKGYEPTIAGFDKFKADLSKIGRERTQLMAGHEGLTVPFKTIVAPLERLENNYAGKTTTPITNRLAVQRVRKQLEKEWLTKYPDGNIPLEEVQSFKETLYKRNENAFGELKKAMSPEIEKAIASGARKGLENALPELGVINRNFKPLLEFYNDFDKAVVRIRKEPYSWTNTVFNNPYLMNKLIRVFRAISPEHPLATPKGLSVALQAQIRKEYQPKGKELTEDVFGIRDTSSVKGENVKLLEWPNNWLEDLRDPNAFDRTTKQIPYDWKAEANKPATAAFGGVNFIMKGGVREGIPKVPPTLEGRTPKLLGTKPKVTQERMGEEYLQKQGFTQPSDIPIEQMPEGYMGESIVRETRNMKSLKEALYSKDWNKALTELERIRQSPYGRSLLKQEYQLKTAQQTAEFNRRIDLSLAIRDAKGNVPLKRDIRDIYGRKP